jgi:hypothetical protein
MSSSGSQQEPLVIELPGDDPVLSERATPVLLRILTEIVARKRLGEQDERTQQPDLPP